MLLETEDLCVAYGDTRVITDVTIGCNRDEVLAILGRNGMGKTTLLKCIAGVLPAENGRIRFDGDDITDLDAHERANNGITLVPQDKGIFPKLTVSENLRTGRFAEATDGSRLVDEDVFEFFPFLRERLDQKAGTLSGGQQQMLAIARGLLTDPQLMLLDEPSEGIQPNIVDEIRDIIRTIHADMHVSVILVEQNLDLVLATSDRGYILENGRIVDESPVDALEDETIQQYLGV